MKLKMMYMFVDRTTVIKCKSVGKCTYEEIQNPLHFNSVLIGTCPGNYGKCVKARKTQTGGPHKIGVSL